MKIKNKQYGVSLLEVMIAVVILSCGFFGIVKLQTHLVSGNSAAKQRDEAGQIAQMKLENLRTFAGLTSDEAATAYENITSDSDVIHGTNTDFTRTWTVTESQSPRQKSVNLQISWTDQNNQQQTASYTTVINGVAPEATGALALNNNTVSLMPTGWTSSVTPSTTTSTSTNTSDSNSSSNNNSSDTTSTSTSSSNNNGNSNNTNNGNGNGNNSTTSSTNTNSTTTTTTPTPVTTTTTSDPTAPCSRSTLIPSSAAYNCESGTSTLQVQVSPSIVLTYNNTSGEVSLINNLVVKTISGTFQLDSATNRRPTNVDLSNVRITAVTKTGNGGVSYCTTAVTGTYTCLVSQGWSGNITGTLVASSSNTNVGSATICHSVGQYSSVVSNATNTINLVKTNRACAPPAGVTQTW